MRELVSVVMPSLNQSEYLEAAIDSVLSQDYAQIELIVADGGSTDQSQEILQRKSQADSRLRWTSCPDAGPADALNRAFSSARGTVLGWLNSDDLYMPGAVSRAMNHFLRNPQALMVYGQGQHIDQDGKTLGLYPTQASVQSIEPFKNECFICQPTVFIKRTAYVLLGPLDQSLATAFDFEYWMRAYSRFSHRIGFIDSVQACSRLHSACITLRMRRSVALEGTQVTARYFGSASPKWLISYVDELLAGQADLDQIDNLREHAIAAARQIEPWLKAEDYKVMLSKLTSDRRLNKRVAKKAAPTSDAPKQAKADTYLPAGSNCLAPEWSGVTFEWALSLGAFCHGAMTLRQCGFRAFSGPFDWIFSNAKVVAHCLSDDFATFLDPAQYLPIPQEEKFDPSANLCDHKLYREKYGVRAMFNHHMPTTERDYEYLTRCVNRFREVLQSPKPKLFLFVSNQAVNKDDLDNLIAQLNAKTANFLLLVVRFIEQEIDPSESLTPLKISQHDRRCLVVNFPAAGRTNGVVFPGKNDNARFFALIRSFNLKSWRAPNKSGVA